MEADMDAALWGGLPSEIAETALSYLSAPVLCRFRTVCKRWNSLICNPEFGALCIRNATQDAAASYVALNYVETNWSNSAAKDRVGRRKSQGWLFLNVEAKRWYTIKAKLTDDEYCFDGFHPASDGRCVAMDGGLVCQLLPGHKKVLVCNPIAQTESKMLPTLTHGIEWARSRVDMVVDVNTGCYTIFVLPIGFETFMVIYESRTNAWRSSTMPAKDWLFVEATVFFNGLLYVLASAIRDACHLWSYNHVEDHWKDTGIRIDLDTLHSHIFLVSDNRLFVAYRVYEGEAWMYQVSEIDLQQRTLRTVLRVTNAAIIELFRIDVMHRSHSAMLLRAFGSGSGIIFMSVMTGITRVYDLRTCTWDVPARESAQGSDHVVEAWNSDFSSENDEPGDAVGEWIMDEGKYLENFLTMIHDLYYSID